MWHEERLLIDGKLVDAEDGATYETISPVDGKVLGTAADASVADADRAIAAARRAFDETDWSTNTELRQRCLRQLHDALTSHREEFSELLVAEIGAPKLLIENGPQFDSPVEMIEYYADLLDTYEFTEDLGEREARGAMHRRWVEKEGIGVCAAIVPYNYPVQITLAKLAPALAAGCTVVVKGPPDSPWVTATLGKVIAEETDIPDGVVNVLFGSSHEVGAILTTDPRVDLVSFTGSTATGRAIMAAASDTVKKLFLELGGKSAFVVLDDADLEIATMMAAFTICSHAGQGCAITSRMLVPRDKYEEALEMTKGVLEGITPADPGEEGTMMGPLVSEQQRDKVKRYVDEAVAAGGRLITGGKVPDDRPDGWFYAPTLLADIDNSAPIAQDEIFGPVLVAIPYDDEDDAVRIANDSIFGLSGTVFGSPERARAVARRIRTGTISVNGGMWYAPDSPFGGYKQSGFGREMGVPGLEEYLVSKTLAEPAAS